MTSSPPRRMAGLALGLAPLVGIVLVALWEIVATRVIAAEAPSDDAWAAAAAEVRAGFHPGDLIVFAPRWVDPLGRRELGDLIPLETAGRMDAARFARIWELSIRGDHAPEVSGLDAVTSTSHGGVTVRRYQQAPVQVVTDFVAALPAARREGAAAGAVAILEEVGFEPHRCVRITPDPGQVARLIYPSAALGQRLVGYVGLADVFTRRDLREPGTLRILIGGRVVAERTVGVDDGWVRFEAPTTPGPADVTVEASAPSRERLICFAAEARK